MNFDIKDVKSWSNRYDVKIGDEGYFFHDIDKLRNSENEYIKPVKSKLSVIRDNYARCFQIDNGRDGDNVFEFFLPLDKVKKDKPEKKYRPFETIEEFVKTIGDIGTIITYREKKEPSQEMRGIFTGYMWDRACRGWILGLGATLYRLENLFELAEYKYKNEWQPFGVEE